MRTAIESQDRRIRAILTEAADGVHVQLLRHAGAVDCRGAGVDGPSMWRQLEAFVVDKPMHLVCSKLEDLVWAMVDDRPVAHYASARRV